VTRDLRYALRGLAKSPGFAAVAVLTLGLGMGANTAIFSVVEALLVRPLPFPEPERLVTVWETQPGERTRPVAPANFLDWRAASRSFSGLASWQEVYRNLVGTGQGVRLDATIVSANFFDVLGLKAARGRTFTPQGDGPRQAVLSHALWRDRFGADPGIIGGALRLDDEPFEIVGVLPPGPVFPEESEVWLLARDDVPELGPLAPVDVKTLRDSRYFAVLGRLAPRVDRAAAQAEMDVIARRLVAAYPVDNADAGVNVVPLQAQLAGATRPSLLLLMGAVGFVLLLGCANVANLLIARAVRREKEIAIRSALGAGRGAIVRQLLTESAVLAALGSALGLVLAAWAGQALLAWLPPETPRLADVRLSLPVLAFTGALAALVTAAFGLLPALGAARADLHPLREAGRTSRSDPARERARGALVVAELAVALVLVTAAGLLAKSLWRLETTSPGLRPERVLTARVSLPGASRRPPAEARAFYARALDRLRALPGLEAVGAAQTLPFQGPSWQAGLKVEGHAVERSREPDVCWRVVSPDYLRTLGVPLLRGRSLAESDTAEAPAVALVNATLARRVFASEDPIGRRLVTGLDGNRESYWVTVVGVVGDTPQQSVAAPVMPEVYRPLAQESRFSGESMRLVARTAGDPLDAAAAVRGAVAQLDPEVPVSDVATLAELGRGSIARQRVTGQMLGAFAAIALLLAALGLYGVLAGLVGERTHEIGVRVALGARPADVIAMVMRRSGRLVAAGTVLGTAGAIATTRLLAGFLYEVTATDPATFAAVVGLLAATAAIASYLPARRATRVDPLVALRTE
jgi:putative ABC transport system permease protein